MSSYYYMCYSASFLRLKTVSALTGSSIRRRVWSILGSRLRLYRRELAASALTARQLLCSACALEVRQPCRSQDYRRLVLVPVARPNSPSCDRKANSRLLVAAERRLLAARRVLSPRASSRERSGLAERACERE